MSDTNIYVVNSWEVVTGGEIIAVCSSWDKANEVLGNKLGTITVLEIDEVYPEGIQDCEYYLRSRVGGKLIKVG